MKPILSTAVFTALLSSLISCRGTTTVNSEQKEFILVQSAITQFQKDTNEYPRSWDDLWNNNASRPSVESLDQGRVLGRRTDMIESFRFIASGTEILLPKDGSTVIGMMIRPMRPPPETRRRFLIVKFKDGTRGVEQIEEVTLGAMFSRAGFDLADYTGPSGNWAPETRLRPLSPAPPTPKADLSDSAMDYNAIPALPLSKMLSTKRKKELWIGGSIALLLLVAIWIWWLTAKRVSTRNSKK